MDVNDKKFVHFPKPINGAIGAKKVTIDGKEVWVKIYPTKVAVGADSMSKAGKVEVR